MTSGRTETKPRSIRVALPSDLPAIQRFNERLRQGGSTHQFPLDPRLSGEAKARPEGYPVFQELLLVEDGEEIRGGIMQYHTQVSIRGEEQACRWTCMPISEGRVDRRYAMVMVALVREALAAQPFQMSIGVRSMDASWARFVSRIGWRSAAVPFLCCPLRPGRVLRELPVRPRYESAWRFALCPDPPSAKRQAPSAALSGLGYLMGQGLAVWQKGRLGVPAYQCVEETRFGGWATAVYEEARHAYGAVVRRDATTLNIYYAPEDSRFIRLRVRSRRTGAELGWVLVAHAELREHEFLGNLRVGTLLDGFGAPEHVPALLHAGTRHLAGRGVDLVVANWSHEAWVRASRQLGFLRGPSNYHFFVSPGGTPLLEPACPITQIHLCRGEGELPVSLLPERRQT